MLDDLVRFMAEEVAMDGSLGCSPRRFTYHISSETSPVHNNRPAAAPPLTPEIIEKTAAYVWRQVVQLPGYKVVDFRKVRPHLKQASDLAKTIYEHSGDKGHKRRAKETKNEHDGVEFNGLNASRLVGSTEKPREALLENAYAESEVGDGVDKGDMMKLKEEYDENVCVVADVTTIRMALTGTRVPNPKFSIVIATVIEMIARARAAGVTLIDIANRASSDTGRTAKVAAQKAFYVAKILVEAGIVVKLKGMAESRASSSVIHTKYIDKNRPYTTRLEYLEVRAKTDAGETEMEMLGDTVLGVDEKTKLPIFPPFGPSQLINREFLLLRLTTLLRGDLWHHLIENKHLLPAMGYGLPVRMTDRRRFQRYVFTFIQEGLLERVLVPSSTGAGPRHCLRLAEFSPKDKETFEGEQLPEDLGVTPGDGAGGEDGADEFALEPLTDINSQPFITFDHTATKEFIILDAIHRSGVQGVNFEQLLETVDYDKKLTEGVVNKFADLGLQYPHLAHYTLVETTERDVRHIGVRWFTLRAYIEHCHQLNVEPELRQEYADALGKIGQFRDVTAYSLYPSREVYFTFLSGATLIKQTNIRNVAGKEDVPYFRGRPRKYVKMIDLNGKILRMNKTIELATHSALPDVLLYNKATNMFFTVPDKDIQSGESIPEPADWHDPTGGATGKRREYFHALVAGEEPPPQPTQADLAVQNAKFVKAAKRRGRPRKGVEAPIETVDSVSPAATPAIETVAIGSPVAAPAIDAAAQEPPKKKARIAKPKAAPRAARSRAAKKAGSASVRQSGDAPPLSTSGDMEVSQDDQGEPVMRHVPDGTLLLDVSEEAVPQNIFEEAESRSVSDIVLSQDTLEMAGSNVIPVCAAPQGIPEEAVIPDDSQETFKDQADSIEYVHHDKDPLYRSLPLAAVPESIQAAISEGTGDSTMVSVPGDGQPAVQPHESAPMDHQPEAAAPAVEVPVGDLFRPKPSRAGSSDLDVERLRKRPRTRVDHNLELQLREILRFVDEHGGISLGKNTLASGLAEWHKTAKFGGEMPEQAIKGKVDGRRIVRLLDMLEASGRINRTTVVCRNASGLDTTYQVVWLPDQPEEQVDQYIKDLRDNGAQFTRTAVDGMDETGFSKATWPHRRPAISPYRPIASLAITHATPEQLHAMSAEEMRGVFRQDWRLLPQQYGWEPGVGRRLELLHRILCDAGRAQGRSFVRRNDVLQQLSVGALCAILPIKDDDGKLLALFESGEASRVAVGDLTGDLARLLSVKQPRMRARFENLFKHLVTMGLAQSREMVGNRDGLRPTSLDRTDHIWLAPTGSVLDWRKAKKARGPIPCLNVPLQTSEDVNTFWYLTWYQTASVDESEHTKMDNAVRKLSEAGRPYEASASVLERTDTLAAQLSVSRAWRKGFALQDTQQRYLQWLVESGNVPDDLQENSEMLEETAHRIFAPLQPTIKSLSTKMARHHRRQEREAQKNKDREADEALRETIRKKIEARQAAREASWSEVLNRACARAAIGNSDNLARYVEAFHRRYLRDPASFNTTQFFEVVSNYVAGMKQKKKPILEGSGISIVAPAVKTSRVRLHWTAQMEELARDAFVVIEYRRKRLTEDAVNKATLANAWSKVFPHVQAYRARRKVTEWMAETPANAEFMKQLALEWEHIQTTLLPDELPDPDPTSLENFDVLLHITMLRQNVKKNALLQRARDPEEGDAEFLPALHNSVQVLETTFVEDSTYTVRNDNGYHAYWLSRASEMAKERDVTSQSAVMSLGMSAGTKGGISREDVMLESAAKTIISTPAASYREDQADILLQNFTTKQADFKYRQMLRDQVLAHAEREIKTGRGFRYTEFYNNSRQTPLASTIFEECKGARDIRSGEYVEWNPICQPGEVAGFLELVSTGKVSAAVDTETVDEILEGWAQSYGASRKIDDEDIEVDLIFRKTDEADGAVLLANQADLVEQQMDKDTAMQDQQDLEDVLALIQQAGGDGIETGDLLTYIRKPEPDIIANATKLVQLGKVFCLGWDRARLVHADHLSLWKATFGSKKAPVATIEDGVLQPNKGDPADHAFEIPCQWLDIYGKVNEAEFKTATNSIMGHIYMRPGVNESVLRGLLSKLFGRHEFNHIVQSLMDRGQVRRFCGDATVAPRLGLPVVGMATNEDERFISYLANGIMKYI